ncbi:Hypothetical protein I5071_380 (plasmid) [Sandaracinus amylolyticus]|nr:hypothetical protein [Sandaracinus sp.]UJR87246.1 Hypothetical protein I5071_380 [Sandaracinus amylolyticus]
MTIEHPRYGGAKVKDDLGFALFVLALMAGGCAVSLGGAFLLSFLGGVPV